MRVLLVEDDPKRCHWFKSILIGVNMDITCDVDEAIRLLKENEYSDIFLDHDLMPEHYLFGERLCEEKTGYVVARFLAEHGGISPSSKIVVHSLNPSGSERMYKTLRTTRAGYVRKVPYTQLTQVMRYEADKRFTR